VFVLSPAVEELPDQLAIADRRIVVPTSETEADLEEVCRSFPLGAR